MKAYGHTSSTCSAVGRRRRRPTSATLVVAMACAALLCVALPLHAESPVADAPGQDGDDPGYIEEYLSDQRRVGSLAGSILGGALIAHPAGTVVGSVLGFFLGSQAMQESGLHNGVEADGTTAEVLALANQDAFGSRAGPGSIGHETAATPAATSLPIKTPGTISSHPVTHGPAHPAAPQSREQIMQICALGPPADPRLRAMCYYFQGR